MPIDWFDWSDEQYCPAIGCFRLSYKRGLCWAHRESCPECGKIALAPKDGFGRICPDGHHWSVAPEPSYPKLP